MHYCPRCGASWSPRHVCPEAQPMPMAHDELIGAVRSSIKGRSVNAPLEVYDVKSIIIEAADAIEAPRGENERLHTRLEDSFAFVNGVRVDVEPGFMPDGIECRDETIELQGNRIAQLLDRALAAESSLADLQAALNTAEGEAFLARKERDGLAEALKNSEALAASITQSDHKRGCPGRDYACACGYDTHIIAQAKQLLGEIRGIGLSRKPPA